MCSSCSDSPFNFALPSPAPNILRVIAIGRSPLVESYILTQYQQGFAQVYEWSVRQRVPDSEEVITLLNKRIVLTDG